MAGLLKHLVEEEKRRNLASQSRLSKILKGLPKGKAYKRKIAKKHYLYLSRRLPNKPHPQSKYIGLVGSDVANKVSKQIEDRIRTEGEIKSLRLELKMLEKALDEYRKAKPNAVTRKAVRRGRKGKGLRSFDTFEELINDFKK